MSDSGVEVIVIRRTETGGTPDDATITELVMRALRAEGATGAWEVSVVLVDDDELRALHRDFM
ncbi:MAG: hypothetical protein IT335_07830, partial [Thermomicrobiales bacterium]|nr:hypothetical protein [Thermomicrobiales bacterium]